MEKISQGNSRKYMRYKDQQLPFSTKICKHAFCLQGNSCNCIKTFLINVNGLFNSSIKDFFLNGAFSLAMSNFINRFRNVESSRLS